MKEASKKCGNCDYMDKYYVKGVTSFERTNCGVCRRKRAKIVNTEDKCKEFVYRRKNKKIERLIRAEMSDMLTRISEIRKILDEEMGNEKL